MLNISIARMVAMLILVVGLLPAALVLLASWAVAVVSYTPHEHASPSERAG